MESAAQERKARIEALRKRKLESDKSRGTTRENGKATPPAQDTATVESVARELAQQVKQEAAQKQKEEVDLFNLAPKKPNWDLKRDVEKKLARLEPQTQRCITNLIRQRLQDPNKMDGLVATVNEGVKRQQHSLSDEE